MGQRIVFTVSEDIEVTQRDALVRARTQPSLAQPLFLYPFERIVQLVNDPDMRAFLKDAGVIELLP